MASKLALFLALSLLAVAVHGCEPYCPGTPAAPTPPVGCEPHCPGTPAVPTPPTPTPPTPETPVGCEPYCPGTPAVPTPPTPTPPTPATPVGSEPYCPGTPAVPTPPTPTTPIVPPCHEQVCPIDVLKLRVCADVLNVVGVKIGVPEHEQCCPLLEKLIDLDAAVCLCTAVRANVLGIHLTVPIDIELILNRCGKHCPSGFTCPA